MQGSNISWENTTLSPKCVKGLGAEVMTPSILIRICAWAEIAQTPSKAKIAMRTYFMLMRVNSSQS